MGLSNSLPNSILQPGVCTSTSRPASPYEGQVIFETDTNSTLSWSGTAWVAVSDDDTLHIDTANNRVGIGTTSPNAALEVSSVTGSGASTTELRISANDSSSSWSTTNPYGQLSFWTADGSSGGPKVHAAVTATSANAPNHSSSLSLATDPDGGGLQNRLTVTSTGNIGIGTTSPDSVVHIDGGTDASVSSGSGYLQVGSTASTNIVMDDNEIMARNNGSTANLFVNPDGGYTHFNSNVANNAVGTESLRIYGIRGQLASSNSPNQLIHLYNNVNIGYPSGWGGQDAPEYGLSVYGAIDSGNPIIAGQMGTAMSHPTGDTILQFNEFWVNNGGITYSSGVFTVPIAGVYRITMNPFMHTNSGSFRVLIGINNAAPYITSHYGHCYAVSGSGYDTLCLDSTVYLTANSNIRFRLYSGQIYNQSGDKFNQFTIAKIA